MYNVWKAIFYSYNLILNIVNTWWQLIELKYSQKSTSLRINSEDHSQMKT